MEKHEYQEESGEDKPLRNAGPGIDRRGFLKGAGLAAIGMAGAAALGGCAPKSGSSSSSSSSSGSNAASGDGFKADSTEQADVVVVGCGASGIMAAHTAAKGGAKVIVLEKGADYSAPNGMYVSGPFAVGTDVLQKKEGGTTLTVDDAFYHVMEYSHWTPNPALIRRCLTESKNAVAQLEGIGYTFKEVNFRFETPFVNEKGGFHLISNASDERVKLWQAALEKDGVDVQFNCQAQSLATENGKVTGVNAIKGSKKVTYKAKVVILAGGGYLGNRDLQERFLHTRKLNVARGGDSICTGDTILAAEAAGGALDKTYGYCPCEYGGTNSKASRPAKQDKFDQNTAFKFGLYGCLLVDQEGKRFINEGLLCDYPMSYGSEQIILNAPWYAVVDQTYVNAMKTQGLYTYTTAKGANSQNWFIGSYFNNPARILTNLDADLEEGIKEGWCYKADTVEDLAKFFGLTNLPDTVKTYNGYCDAGVDAEFGANPWYLSKVATPPFYVTENEPSAWSTFGGIRTDDCCRVLKDKDNTPFDNLFAVGTDSGSLYYSPYYDIPGFCYGLCIDSGYISATEALKVLK